MEVTIYGSRVMHGEVGALALSFEPIPSHPPKYIGGETTIEVRPEDRWEIRTPDDARLERAEDGIMCLSWKKREDRVFSTPNDVLSFARLQIHHFRFANEEMNRRPIRVSDGGTVGPYIDLPFSRLDEVRRHLDDHGVRYWVEENVISFNGGPEMVVVNMRRGTDPNAVQAILDGIR